LRSHITSSNQVIKGRLEMTKGWYKINIATARADQTLLGTRRTEELGRITRGTGKLSPF